LAVVGLRGADDGGDFKFEVAESRLESRVCRDDSRVLVAVTFGCPIHFEFCFLICVHIFIFSLFALVMW